MSRTAEVVVIGGGIVGLATAFQLVTHSPESMIVLLEKESEVATHQTGRNSGVLHSGIYYKPGSLKAELCMRGRASMIEFCREHGIPFDICGKLIVATNTSELPGLQRLHDRALAHGLSVERLGPDGIRDVEPYANGIAALRLDVTGIVDYGAVGRAMRDAAERLGVRIVTDVRATAIRHTATSVVVSTADGPYEAGHVVNCAGLFSDRIARQDHALSTARIVPFRGEYFTLSEDARTMVRGLIYPVPDPEFPFLGVHLTKTIGGGVHAGPNAVLALAREGYRWRDVSPRDIVDTISYPGFWRLARRHYRTGFGEVARSLSKRRFLTSLQRLVPELEMHHLVRDRSGVRAQALTPTGDLVDDFLIVGANRVTHVCNAPSPAATSSLEIGALIASTVRKSLLES